MSSTSLKDKKTSQPSIPKGLILGGLFVLLLLSSVGCKKTEKAAGGQIKFEINKSYQRGPLTANVRIDKNKITIADTISLELDAVIEPGYEVNMPKIDSVLKNFGIVDWQDLGNRLDVNDNIVSTYRYRLEPFLSGTFAIPALTFEFHDVNEQSSKVYQLTTDPIDIEVTSLLGEQRSKLAIADIEDTVDMPSKISPLLLVPAAAAVLIIAAIFIYVRRKKNKLIVRVYKSAHEIAYARLQALVRQNLVKAGKIKQFYEAISDILRHYIEDRFELRAPERTTEEFLFEIQNTNVLSGAIRKSLKEFLTHCDLVKFARHSPSAEQIQRTFDLAKGFIEQTKSDERKIDVTDRIETDQLVGPGKV